MKTSTRILIYGVLGALSLALGATVSQCYAGGQVITTTSNCGSSYNRTSSNSNSGCETTTVITKLKSWGEMSPEEKAEVRAEQAETEARVAQWEAFCKPVVVYGEDGIGRYRYAHKNCDMGRRQ